MPRYTEKRVEDLCAQIIAANNLCDERIIPEFRAALKEHIELARQSLASQASVISLLDSLDGPSKGQQKVEARLEKDTIG